MTLQFKGVLLAACAFTLATAASAEPPRTKQTAIEPVQPAKLLLASRGDDGLRNEVGRLREEVARLSLDAMISNILAEEARAPRRD